MNGFKDFVKGGLEGVVNAVSSGKGQKAVATARIAVGSLALVSCLGIGISAAVTGFPYLAQNAREAFDAVQGVAQNAQAMTDYAAAAMAVVKAVGVPALALYGWLGAAEAGLNLAWEGKDRLDGVRYRQQTG
ncbi:hypothetical protein HYV85_05735 [Candidatus Woesearchaeota archaeon]|nr:hypothetical protein [Candidatus Woesearchaeota archaeon]